MKKLFLQVLLSIFCVGWVSAQSSVAYYDFKAVQGDTYTALGDDATALTRTTEVGDAVYPLTLFNENESVFAAQQVTTMAGIPIGFDFNFDGKVYDKFVVVGAGFIYLGLKTETQVNVDLRKGIPNVSNIYTGAYPSIGVSASDSVRCVAPLKYQLTGDEGSRVLTVEFSVNYKDMDLDWHYQIRLYEADSKIEMLFDELTMNFWAERLAVGLAGETSMHYRSVADDDFVQTNLNTTTGVPMISNKKFVKGLQYIFSMPAECAKPTATVQFTSTAVTSTSVYLKGVLSATDADAYMVVASTGSITGDPVDGTTYKVGDALAGGTVLAIKDLAAGTTEFGEQHGSEYEDGLEPNTSYYYAVWLYKYKCSGDVRYGDRFSLQATTRTTAPASLGFISVSDTEIKLKATANSLGQDILVAVTNVNGKDQNNNTRNKGDFGIPAAGAKVGDTIFKTDGSFGGKVIYKGAATGEITCADVTDNRLYHFGAFSKDAEGNYSSVFAQADTLSSAKLPFYEDFANLIAIEEIGWAGSTNFSKAQSGIQCDLLEVTTDTVRRVDLGFPVMDYPEKPVRVVLSYLMTAYEGRVNAGYKAAKWSETDSLVFEVSTDGGLTYKPAYAITKLNADDFPSTSEFLSREITIKGFGNAKQAKLRMRWMSSQKSRHLLRIASVRLFEMPECDYPTTPLVDSIVGSEALVSWMAGQSEEKTWNLGYASKNGEDYGEWTTIESVSATSYLLNDLQSNTVYKVRVQAVCGVGSVSTWVESSEFTSGWSAPFIEDFNNLSLVNRRIVLPNGWDIKQQSGNIPDTLSVETMSTGNGYFYTWKKTQQAIPGTDNGTITFPVGTMASATSVMCLPIIRLDADETANFVFDAAYGSFSSNTFEAVGTAANENYRMYLWVSTDGGKTFVNKDTLRSWTANEMAAFGDSTHIQVDLSAYAGKDIVLAIGVTGVLRSSAEMLWLDNMGIVYACPLAKKLTVKDITRTTATVVWNADPTVSAWIVKLNQGETEITEETVTGNTFQFTELEEATDYTVSVGHICGEEEDPSRWATLSFTTGGVQCDAITDLTVSEITRNSARLAWNGEALRYRIRIRAVSQEQYAYYTTDIAEYEFENLLSDREYEGGVQSICGEAITDTSAYVSFENFTTTGITCFAPTEISVEPAYATAVVSWTGDADDYQLAYRKDGTTQILGIYFAVGTKTYTLAGLTEKTPYEVRVRSICAAGDTSVWSDWEGFTTVETPVCPAPADLKVESITETSARLAWTCTDENAGFILRYRESSVTVWDSVKDLEENSYELTDLKQNTAYSWAVLTACTGNRYSGWTSSTFTTLEETANEAGFSAAFKVYATKGQIHVLNPGALWIDGVRVVGTDGVLLDQYKVKSNENLLLTTGKTAKVAVVIVEHNGKTAQYKVFLP